MSSLSLLAALGFAAASIGILHTLAPDHWLPIAAVSRAGDWSLRRTARVAFLCGFGHVSVSALLGLVALFTGTRVVEAFGTHASSVAGLLLIGFGVAYALWGARHWLVAKLHGHSHAHFDHVHEPRRRTVWALFAIYCADPCIAVVPIIFAAAPLSVPATLGIVVVYEAATIATMVGLSVAARAGAFLIPRGSWTETHGDTVAGAVIAVTGIGVALLGI